MIWQMPGPIGYPRHVRYVQHAHRVLLCPVWFFVYGIDNGQLVLDAYEGWFIVGAVPLVLAVGQQLGLAKKLQAAIVAVIIDALAVQHLMAIQLMLELKLIVTLVAYVNAAVLPMQMIVEEDPARCLRKLMSQ